MLTTESLVNAYLDRRLSVTEIATGHCMEPAAVIAQLLAVGIGLKARRSRPKLPKPHRERRTPLHLAIRMCDEAQEWRLACLARDNYTCQVSGLRGGYLHVHHLRPFSAILGDFLAENSDLHPERDHEALVERARRYCPFWDTANGQTLRPEIHRLLHLGQPVVLGVGV